MIYLRVVVILFAAVTVSVAQTLTSSSMLEDFDMLRKAIEEAHGGLYRYNDPATINKMFTQQRAKLSTARTKYEFISIISETLSGLRDGHMRLEYDAQTRSEIERAKMLPLRFSVEGSRLIVLFNDTKDNNSIRPGIEVTSINRHSAATLINTMLSRVSGDGFVQTGKHFLIERNFPMYYWLFIDQGSEFNIEAKDSSGKTTNVRLTGVSSSDRITNRNVNQINAAGLKQVPQSRSKNIMLQFHDSNSLASISIRGFEGSDFTDELDAMFRQIQQNKTKAVILDLRGNGGGTDSYGAYLVSQFTDKPFRYFDHIHLRDIDPSFAQARADLKDGTVRDPAGGFLVTPALHPGVGIQQPGKNPFKGSLIVLMNGGTFSTAADVTAVLRGMKRAVFVGEESGGAYEGNTSGVNARLTLPNCGMSVRIQMYDYWNAVPAEKKGRGTFPDYAIDTRVADIIQGVDAQMDQAVKLAKAAH